MADQPKLDSIKLDPSTRSVPELDAILGKVFPILDHGFIRVVDYMGSDAAVVQAARVSYGIGTKSVSDDAALIRYLLRHAHTTPFEMCEIKLHVKMPIFVARQWIRHRTANVNEYSGRYSIIDKDYYVPAADTVATQSSTNRQGRGNKLDTEVVEHFLNAIRSDSEHAYNRYLEFLNGDTATSSNSIARELARIGLGVNFYTQWYWKIDLHNFMHFISLRADEHAQFEIRQYASKMLELLETWMPTTYRAFLDYRLNSATFSAPALKVLRRLIAGEKVSRSTSGLAEREWSELQAKLGFKID